MTEKPKKNFLSDLSHKFTSSDKKSLNVVVQPPTPTGQQQQTVSPRPPPVNNKPGKSDAFKVRVVYSYTPLNDDELRINENDIVDVIKLVC